MTVCIAALCDSDRVFGATDRMLTTGDRQYETNQAKCRALTTSVAVMIAGDISIQNRILEETKSQIELLGIPSEKLCSVKYIADMYASVYRDLHFGLAERHILYPLGLSKDSWISQQQQLSPILVDELKSRLYAFSGPDIQALVIGVDDTGGHIYEINRGDVSCKDYPGFACIGSGWYHASSEFAFASHSRFATLAQTLLRVYMAKKKAEFAPGIGPYTDMFFIEPDAQHLPPCAMLDVNRTVINDIDKMYKGLEKKRTTSLNKAYEDANKYVGDLLAKTQLPVPEG